MIGSPGESLEPTGSKIRFAVSADRLKNAREAIRSIREQFLTGALLTDRDHQFRFLVGSLYEDPAFACIKDKWISAFNLLRSQLSDERMRGVTEMKALLIEIESMLPEAPAPITVPEPVPAIGPRHFDPPVIPRPTPHQP